MSMLQGVLRRHLLPTKLSHDEAGATAIEYGLIAALIAVAAIAAWSLVGTSLTGVFNTAGSAL